MRVKGVGAVRAAGVPPRDQRVSLVPLPDQLVSLAPLDQRVSLVPLPDQLVSLARVPRLISMCPSQPFWPFAAPIVALGSAPLDRRGEQTGAPSPPA